jgi:hypothetical protein
MFANVLVLATATNLSISSFEDVSDIIKPQVPLWAATTMRTAGSEMPPSEGCEPKSKAGQSAFYWRLLRYFESSLLLIYRRAALE